MTDDEFEALVSGGGNPEDAIEWQVSPEGKPVAPTPAWKKLSKTQQALQGAKQSFTALGSGINTAVGKPEFLQGVLPNQRDVNRLRKANEGSNMAALGTLGGDLAQVLPAFGLTKALAPMGRAAQVAGDIGYSAGQGALTANEGEGAHGATLGAVGSVAGLGLGKALGRTVFPAGKLDPDAQMLIDAGIPLTPGQAAPKSFMNPLEKALTRVPILGGAVDARQADAAAGTTQALAQQFGLDPLQVAGQNGQRLVDTMGTDVARKYAKAADATVKSFSNSFNFDPVKASAIMHNTPGAELATIRQLEKDIPLVIAGVKNAATPADAFKAWKKGDELIGAAGPNFDNLKAAWRDEFHATAGKATSRDVLDADLSYRQLDALRNAVKGNRDATPKQDRKSTRLNSSHT